MGRNNVTFMGRNLTEISNATGISMSYLSLIFSGKRKKVSKAILARIASAFNISIEEVEYSIQHIQRSPIIKHKLVSDQSKQQKIISQTLDILEHFDIERLKDLKNVSSKLSPSEFELKEWYSLWIDGILAARNNQFEEAQRFLDEAKNFRPKTAHEKRMLAKIYGGLGSVYIVLSNNKIALQMFKKSLRLWNTGFDAALVYLNLGTLYRRMRKFPNAIKSYMMTLDFGYGYIKTLAYSGLGQIYIDINDLPTARTFLLEGYVYLKRTRDKWGSQDLLCNLGIYYKLSGQLKRAEYILTKGLKYAQDLGATRVRDYILLELAEVYLLLNTKEKAAAIFDGVNREVSLTGDMLLLGTSFLSCSKKYLSAFFYEDALKNLNQCYKFLNEVGPTLELLECCKLLQLSHSRKHNIAEAQFFKNEILKIKNKLNK